VTSAQMRDHRLDLRWLSDDGGAGKSNASGGRPAIDPAIAAMPGLSLRLEEDLSDEAYGAVLKDVVAHFGLPSSLQEAALLHLADPISDQRRGYFDRKFL